MRSFYAAVKKEIRAQIRTGKMTVLCILFILFGIMNPAVAKCTPWLLEMMADSLAQSGMTVAPVTVSAMDSWVQFFKNIPMALIAFVLMESSIFAEEYGSGTLILSLTKGLSRCKVVLSKTLVLLCTWTAGYWLCFCITYGYNAYFWDNAVSQNLAFSALCWWLFGVWVIGLTVLFSAASGANTGVLLGTGGTVLLSVLLGMIPKVKEFVPTFLTDGNSLIYGISTPESYAAALSVTAALTVLCFAVSIPVMNKKQL